jgi:hypothetical protein
MLDLDDTTSEDSAVMNSVSHPSQKTLAFQMSVDDRSGLFGAG